MHSNFPAVSKLLSLYLSFFLSRGFNIHKVVKQVYRLQQRKYKSRILKAQVRFYHHPLTAVCLFVFLQTFHIFIFLKITGPI